MNHKGRRKLSTISTAPNVAPSNGAIVSNSYNEQTRAEFFERLLSGRSIKSVCEDYDMPAEATVKKWMWQNSDFRERVLQAQAITALTERGRIREIADGELIEREIIGQDKHGETKILTIKEMENVQRSKLRIDVRLEDGKAFYPEYFGTKNQTQVTLSNTVEDFLKEIGNGHTLPGTVKE